MKLIICGKSFIACNAVRYIFDRQKIVSTPVEIIVLPVVNDTGKDTWEPSLAKTATSLGVPVIHSFEECQLKSHDIVLSLEYNKIIRAAEIGNAHAYNIHFSDLPKYRGCLTSVWPIRNGETHAGVSLHILTDPVDSGDIIDKIRFPIPPHATCFDLYMLYNAFAFELFKKNYQAIISGKIRTVVQDHTKSTYYKRSSVNFSDVTVTDFNQPVVIVSRYIRSLIFPPYQLPTFQGKPIKQCDSVVGLKRADHKPSTIIFQDQSHAIVACKDGYLRMFFNG